ncbi:MAG: penicillin-binding transpeptidase domain-containing protein, partial [Peptostreptococcaceae bacterium]
MDEKQVNDRFIIIRNTLLIVFAIIIMKIVYMASFKYDYYIELAENKAIKQIPIKASRGDIRDTNGRLLATSKNLFTVQVSADGISKTDENKQSRANEISLRLINLLEANKEEYKDEFPIYVKGGKYYYIYDREIEEYKESAEIPQNLNAKESFYYLVDRMINEGTLAPEDRRLDATKLQAKMNKNGEYPPILVSTWMFTAEKNKVDWLQSYKIKEANISAEKAFNEIRNYYSSKPNTPINEGMSASDARKVLIVRDLIKSQGYSRYSPITIAQGVSETTISQIEENIIQMPGVSVANEPVRYYPNGTLAAHVLGHIGKIPSNKESEYLEKGYLKSDLVGVAGIEKSYEDKLRGTDGYKKVQVDALGKISKEIEVKEPKSGDTVYLSIDKDLQEVAEDSLKRTLDYARNGGTFKSQYGDKSAGGTAPNAKSGALMVVDVKSGDVLASVSYPSYDPNLFTKGSVSYEEYKGLEPENKNDYLAPSKQINLATQGVFQPGSTFKMITGMAGLENGLDPNFAISDPGVIRLGERPFADLIWHKSRRNHGVTNLYKAIQESCNIYFYTIGTGKSFGGIRSPGIDMGPEKILNTAKLFGLDEYTGLYEEIEEKKGKVPTIEQKLKSIQSLLRSYLDKNMANDFVDITKSKNPDEYEKRIDEIVSWAEEPETPGRVEVINRLLKMKVKEDRAEPLADKIFYDYLKQAKWTDADTFNLAIGQGENSYTPAQMVRFTAAIANGGKLVDLSVVEKSISSDYKSVEDDPNNVEEIDFKDKDN